MTFIQNWLDGKKTLIGGISALLTGLAAFLNSLGDGLQFADLSILGGTIATFLVVIGLGHKLEKVSKLLGK